MSMIKVLFLIFLIIPFSAYSQVVEVDTLRVSDIFDPSSNLGAIERAEELTFEINYRMGHFRQILFNVATPVMMMLIILFQLFLIVFLPLMFVNSYLVAFRRKKDFRYIKDLSDSMSDYLLSLTDIEPPIIKNMKPRQQRLLLEYVSSNTRFFGGIIRQRLIKAYRANISPQSISSFAGSVKSAKLARLIRQGVRVEPRPEAARLVEKYLNSPNPDIRLWSRILYMKVYPEKFTELMFDYPFELSGWDRVVYCDFLIRNRDAIGSINIEKLLTSQNSAVVSFAYKITEIENR